MSQIRFEGVDAVYGGRADPALHLLDQGLERAEIRRRTGLTVGVADATLSVEAGEVCVLMGLSGSGKSSLLRCINGLNPVSRGRLWVGEGDDAVELSRSGRAELARLRTRQVAMVFQSFALLPWLSVAANVAFGLGPQRLAAAERRRRVGLALEQVGLADYATSRPGALSGGMRQRVGLARALATDCPILLMDEPFSALDPLIRHQLQEQLLSLRGQLRRTIVFVSHDLDEALRLGDRVVMMRDGRIVQQGRPEDILLSPADDYVRDFVSRSNPLDVLRGHSLMRALPVASGCELCLDRERGWWLELDGEGQLRRLRWGDETLAPQRWQQGMPLGALRRRPTLVPADIALRDALAVRQRCGHPLLLEGERGRLLGTLGDDELYRAVLGRWEDRLAG